MGVIDRFEGMVEGVVEGSFSRLFRSKLSLAEIQKRLERVMEERREIAVGRAYVPNRYEVFLNPSDFQDLTTARIPKAQAEHSLTEYVVAYARQRNYSFGGGSGPRVWLSSSDQARRHGIVIKSFTVDPNQVRAAQSQMPAMDSLAPTLSALPAYGTAIMNIGALPLTGQNRLSGPVARPEASLQVLEYPSSHPMKVIRFNKDITLGRGLDNEIIFHDDSRISRHHARIEFKYGQFLLFDLNSTNGSYVNSRPVTQIVLSPNDRISLGGLEMVFQV